jgi:hypothetical protein
MRLATLVLGLGIGAMLAPSSVWSADDAPERSVLGAAKESLFGDPYSQPDRWQPLSLDTFFSEGWDEAWINPPKGSGGAPRQSWLNAFNGVFYRLVNFPFTWSHDGSADSYTASVNLFTPLSRRFEVEWSMPYLVSSPDADGDRRNHVGDFSVTPRVILSESQDFTQSFNLTFRTPTGDLDNHNGVASVTPEYEFWWNTWRGLVVRGGVAMNAPYNHDGVHEAGARTTFLANFAAGYYFTPHDMTPIGDLVWYVSTNLSRPTDNHGPDVTTLSFTPGFRTHIGWNWFLFGGVEVPVTHPEPFDYQVLGEVLKVF